MLKLVSLNIELDKHLDAVEEFLLLMQPDAVCLQEIFDIDVPRFATALGAEAAFLPMLQFPEQKKTMGLAILSRAKITARRFLHYKGDANTVPMYDSSDELRSFLSRNEAVLFCEIEKDDMRYKIGTTHFTWTPDGRTNEEQRTNVAALLSGLASEGEFIFAGDFNAPREIDGKPGEIYVALTERLKDNIPPEIRTSIDGTLHRKGPMERMVDYIFSTPQYRVSDVSLQGGVSDHLAVLASIA